MSSTRLPEISSLLSLPSPTQHQVLDTLFEPSPHLHDLAASLFSQQEHPASYASYNDLIDTVGGSLSKLGASDSPHDREILFDILGSHPRLGEKSPAKLSELSRTEQANLKTAEDQHAANTEAQLRKMNAAYEERFPGLRYVVFVNGRGRDAILQDMKRRIERNDLDLEISETIKAMCDIAADRVQKLQAI